MRVEWKQKGYDWLRAVLWAACGILPLPFGAFASGKPYIAAASILVFFILSFAVPLWLGYRRRKAGRYDDYASAGATFYLLGNGIPVHLVDAFDHCGSVRGCERG